jgi:hypothetical protein
MGLHRVVAPPLETAAMVMGLEAGMGVRRVLETPRPSAKGRMEAPSQPLALDQAPPWQMAPVCPLRHSTGRAQLLSPEPLLERRFQARSLVMGFSRPTGVGWREVRGPHMRVVLSGTMGEAAVGAATT